MSQADAGYPINEIKRVSPHPHPAQFPLRGRSGLDADCFASHAFPPHYLVTEVGVIARLAGGVETTFGNMVAVERVLGIAAGDARACDM